MDNIKLEPIDDHEAIRKIAGRYIHHVMSYAELLEQVGIRHPTVFMSPDVISIMSRSWEDVLKYVRPLPTSEEILTFCGYRVKIVDGENVLYIGVKVL